MAEESLSEHCSLMARPGGPAKSKELPADCPKGAVYIRGTGGTIIAGDATVPMIFEGGDGDDKIVIVGSAKGGVLVRGGAGRDSITLESHWTWLAHQIGMPGFVILGTATIMLAVVLTICWRALKQER